MAAPLVSAGELQTYIQRPIDAQAALLAVEAASSVVREHCGWGLSREQAVFYVNGNNSRVLSLPTLNLLAVDRVWVDGIETSNYRWAQRGQLYRLLPWPDYRKIQVECVHGYDPVPAAIKVVALAFAARQVGNPERFRTAAVGSVSRTFDLDRLDTELLFPYRLYPSS